MIRSRQPGACGRPAFSTRPPGRRGRGFRGCGPASPRAAARGRRAGCPPATSV